MKTQQSPIKCFPAWLVAAPAAHAASVIKADTGTDLNDPSSWTDALTPTFLVHTRDDKKFVAGSVAKSEYENH